MTRLQHVEDHLDISNNLITVTITPNTVNVLENAPRQIEEHIAYIIDDLITSGKSLSFEISMKEFTDVWHLLQTQKLDHNIKVIVAIGGTRIKGIRVDFETAPSEKATISIEAASNEIKRHHYLWLTKFVDKYLSSKGCHWKIDPASVQSAWYRSAVLNEEVKNHPLERKSDHTTGRINQNFIIKARPLSGDIIVVVTSIRNQNIAELRNAILQDVRISIKKLAEHPLNTSLYWLFEDRIKLSLEKIYNGPQALNCSLPVSFLGAIRINSSRSLITKNPLIDLIMIKAASSKNGLKNYSFLNQHVSMLEVKPNIEILKQAGFLTPNLNAAKQLLSFGWATYRANEKLIAESLHAAKQGLNESKAENRDFRTLLLAISKGQINTYHEIVQELKSELTQILSSESQGNLFQMNLQFSPLTRETPTKQTEELENRKAFNESKMCNLLVREMAGLIGAIDDPTWFFSHLIPNISKTEIKKSLVFLKKEGFLKAGKSGRELKQSNKDIIAEMIDYVKGKEFYSEIFDFLLQSKTWSTTPYQQDFSTISFNASAENIVVIKQICEKYMAKIFELEGKDINPSQVYHFSLQLFPTAKTPS